MHAAHGATLFCEMFYGDPKLFCLISLINFYEFYGHIVTNMANLL